MPAFNNIYVQVAIAGMAVTNRFKAIAAPISLMPFIKLAVKRLGALRYLLLYKWSSILPIHAIVRLMRQSSSFCAAESANSTSGNYAFQNFVYLFAVGKYHILVVAVGFNQQKCFCTPSFRSKLMPSCSITHSIPAFHKLQCRWCTPALNMAETAAQASSFELKDASIKASSVGRGISFHYYFGNNGQCTLDPISNWVRL
jgi:hypothetical protein